MLKRTLIEIAKGCRFCRYEHPTRGTIETLSYPCDRLVYVAKGFGRSSPPAFAHRARKRLEMMWKSKRTGTGGDA